MKKWNLWIFVLHVVYSPVFFVAFLLDGLDGNWSKRYMKKSIFSFLGFKD